MRMDASRKNREKMRAKYFSTFSDKLFERINNSTDEKIRGHLDGRDLNKEILGKDIKFIQSEANILRRELNRTELLDKYSDGELNDLIDETCQQGSEKAPREQYPRTWDHFADNLKAGADKLAQLKKNHPNDWQKIIDAGGRDGDLSTIDVQNMKMASDVLTLALANAGTNKIEDVDMSHAIKTYMGMPTTRRRLVDDVNNEMASNYTTGQEGYLENLQQSVDDWAEHLGDESGNISPDDVQWLKSEIKNWESNKKSKGDLHIGSEQMGDMLEEMSDRFGAESRAYQVGGNSGNRRAYMLQAKVLGPDGQSREAAPHHKLPRMRNDPEKYDLSSIKTELKSTSNVAKLVKVTKAPQELSSKDIALWHAPYFRQMISQRHEYLAKNSPNEKALQEGLKPLPSLQKFVNEQSDRGSNPDIQIGKVKTPEQFVEKWVNGNKLASHTTYADDEISTQLSAVGRFSQLRRHLEKVTGGQYKGVELDGVKSLSTLSGKDLINVQNEAASIKNDLGKLRELADEFDGAAKNSLTPKTDRPKFERARDMLRATANEMEKELQPLTQLRGSWLNQAPKESLMRHPPLLYYRDKYMGKVQDGQQSESLNATGSQVANIALANSHHKLDVKLMETWNNQRGALDDFATFLNTKGHRLRELEVKRTTTSLDKNESLEFSSLRKDLKQLEQNVKQFKATTEKLQRSGKNLDQSENDLFEALGKSIQNMETYFTGERREVAKSARSLLQRQAHVHTFTDSRVGLDLNLGRMDRDRTVLGELQKSMLGNIQSQSAIGAAENPNVDFVPLPSLVNVHADSDAIENFEEFEYDFRQNLQNDPGARDPESLTNVDHDIEQLKQGMSQLESSSKRLKAMRSVIDNGKFEGKLTGKYYWGDDRKTTVGNNHIKEYLRVIDQYTQKIDEVHNTMQQRLGDLQTYANQVN